MRKMRAAMLGLALVLAPVATPSVALAGPLSADQLKVMVTNMGYTPKLISTAPAAPKYEITTKAGTFTVPIGLEVSTSGRYIWASATLGSAANIDGAKAIALLKLNASNQPNTFWITSSGSLVCGMAIDNREVTPAHLKFVFDKIGADIAASASVWGK